VVQSRRSLRSALVFFAFTTPLGIAAHLVSEFAALGRHDDLAIVLSPRHAYLGVLAVMAACALALALRRVPADERRACVERLVAGLPFGGRGVRFTAVSFAAQFAFFALTQLGEGAPLSGGNVLAGVLAAALAAAIGALAVVLGQRRVLDFVLALAYACALLFASESARFRCAARRRATSPARRRAPFAFRYRPPPFAQQA
jgi:hypothetical protein